MRWFAVLLLVLLCSPGCKEHCTVVPLAEEDNSIIQDELVGTWVQAKDMQDADEDPDVLLHFFKREKSGYLLSAENPKKDETLDLEVVPFAVGKYRFLQFRRKESANKQEQKGLLRVCYFARYDVSEDDLYIQFASTGQIQELLEEQGLPLIDSEGKVLFTGTREPMLDFLKDHTEELYPNFKKNGRLRRVTDNDASKSNS